MDKVPVWVGSMGQSPAQVSGGGSRTGWDEGGRHMTWCPGASPAKLQKRE